MAELKETAVKGVYWAFINEAGIKIISFVVSIILTRYLLPADFGLFAATTLFTNIAQSFTSLGLSSSLIRNDNNTENDYSTVFIANILMGISVYGLIYLVSPMIENYYNQGSLANIIRIISISLVIGSFSNIFMTKLTKDLRFKDIAIVTLTATLVGSFVAIYMAFRNYGVMSIIAQSISTSLVQLGMFLFLTKWMPKIYFNKDSFRKHFSFGVNLALSGTLNTVFNELYTFVIGRNYSMTQLGYYNRAQALSQFPSMSLSIVVNKVAFPVLSTFKDNDTALKTSYKQIMKSIIFIIAPILFISATLATPLFRIVFTEKWLDAVPYFQLLIFNGLLLPLQLFNLHIVAVKGRSDLYLRAEVIKKIVILLMVAATISLGIKGLIIGSIISSLFSLGVNIYYSTKVLDYGFSEQFIDLLPSLFIATITALFVYFIDKLVMNNSDILRIFIGTMSGIITYYLISHMFKMEELRYLKSLIKLNA